MALLCAKATGSAANFTTAATWGLVDSTSLLRSETGATALTTSYQESSSFTPGAITIDGIAVALNVRTGTTGTMTVRLAQGGADVSGTVVTINCSNLPVAASADVNGGWIFFKFASPVTLLAATAYTLSAKTSSSNQVSLWRDSTAANWSRFLRTTTTQAPAAGDDLIICREWTAAATNTTSIVTQDNTAATIFGSNTTSTVTPALAICDGGTLQSGTSASTAYLYKVRGHVIVYSGGTLSLGTSGTRIPATSSCTVTFDVNGSNVDFGLVVRNLGIMNAYGDNGRAVSALLAANASAGATSLTTNVSTSWKNGDSIGIASTTRTASECEKKALTADASGTSLTISALTNAHSGTSPTQAELINLTRNVLIQGASDTLQSYIYIAATAIVNWSHIEVYRMGSATTGKRGIDVATTTGTFVADSCSFHDFVVASSIGINQTGTTGQTTSTMAVTNCVTFGIANAHYINVATTGTWSVAGSIFIRNTDNSSLVLLNDVGGTIDGIIAVGGSGSAINAAILFAEISTAQTCTAITAHSNASNGVTFNAGLIITIGTLTVWRNNLQGVAFRQGASGQARVTINGGNIFGNTIDNVSCVTPPGVVILSGVNIAGDSTFATTNGIGNSQAGVSFGKLRLYNCTLGVASGIFVAHTNDINISSFVGGTIHLNSCILASANEVVGSFTDYDSGIFSQRHDQTNGVYKAWVAYGIITTDTTIYRTASPSMRMTPSNASSKMQSALVAMGMKYAGASGTTITASVYVYKSTSGDGAAYNGNQPRLIVRRNDAVGITADTVLATYSAGTGSFNLLTGTTPTLSDDGVVEIIVDCDGTAGWINVDDWGI